MRRGYKQTDVGLIPETWEVHTIGKSMRLINGRAFKPSDWTDRGVPIIRIQNLNNAEANFNYWSGPIEERHRIEAGNLLFAWSGTTNTSFGARIWNGPTGVLNQHIFKVIPNEKYLTLGYAFVILRKVQSSIEKEAHGFKASFVHIRKSDLVRIELPLPPTKAEQQSIAEALSDADALIESLEQLIAKKRQIKQGAMQKLLTGKRRLPGFTGGSKGTLGELFNPRPPRRRISNEEEVTFLGMEDISEQGEIIRQNIIRMSDLRSGFTAFARNDVLVAKITPCFENGKGAVLDGLRTGSGFGSTEFLVLRAKNEVDPRYLYFQTRMPAFRRQLESQMIGTAGQKRVPIRAVIDYALPILHELPEQQAIATILTDMDSEISALKSKLTKARQLKHGMMQELLTGRIRLI